mgnify:CR=1 FL=1
MIKIILKFFLFFLFSNVANAYCDFEVINIGQSVDSIPQKFKLDFFELKTNNGSFFLPIKSEEVCSDNKFKKFQIDYQFLKGKLHRIQIEDYATTSKGFKVKIQPLDYKTLTKVQIAKFEQQKMYGTINSSTLTEEQKQTAFSKSFETLNTVNFSLLLDSIQEITTPDGAVVTDKQQIMDFVNNSDTKTVREIEEKLIALRLQAQMKPIKVKATEEQIKKGVPATFEVPITFDNSNFFG